jgi:chitobiase/beta-hexosaminidase-like protein/Fn3 domain-containing protein
MTSRLCKYGKWIFFVASAAGMAEARPDDFLPTSVLTFNRLRFTAVGGHEREVLGAKILASNVSPTDGFVELGTIIQAPHPGQWAELPINNSVPYRWIKYYAAPGSHGRIGKIEFYAGDQLLKPKPVFVGEDSATWANSLSSDKPDGHHDSRQADNQYVVVDLADAATGSPPWFVPGQTESGSGVQVRIASKAQHVLIRYTLDGTTPTRDYGNTYSHPLTIDRTATITAASFADGLAPTRTVSASYIIGEATAKKTFHIGNSLTGVTDQFDVQARTAGAQHHSDRYLIAGGSTKTLWNTAMDPMRDPGDPQRWLDSYGQAYPQIVIEWGKRDWVKLWPSVNSEYSDLTLQPRDFNVEEEADYDNRFLALFQQKAPNIQPWLYIEWTERERQRPTDLGKQPTSEMRTVYPALTWEESMGAMMVYGEDVRRQVNQTYRGRKPILLIPAALAMGWIHHLIEEGQVPGFAKDDFYPRLFKDSVHVNVEGAYLIDCLFYAAFYGESPEDRLLPVATQLTSQQAKIMQKLAWDTLKNYPYSGLYETGTNPVSSPQYARITTPAGEARITLTSATPGSWFRYTLDGTHPSRTNGYIYCGAISVRPGVKILAIAYKSGMADSGTVDIM